MYDLAPFIEAFTKLAWGGMGMSSIDRAMAPKSPGSMRIPKNSTGVSRSIGDHVMGVFTGNVQRGPSAQGGTQAPIGGTRMGILPATPAPIRQTRGIGPLAQTGGPPVYQYRS